MHAVVATVSIVAGQFEEARKHLHDNVVPRVSKAPGFVKGYWSAAQDRRSGVSFLVFHTEVDANNAAQMARSNPMPPSVTANTIEVREIVAEA